MTSMESPDQQIGLQTSGIHHLALRVRNFDEARRFYIELLGFEKLMEAPGLLLFRAGSAVLGIRGPSEQSPENDRFDPHRVGLDHIALSCADEVELNRVTRALDAAGVENTGVKVDETLGKKYVAFKDPDRIAWEFYME
jgi:glyoxylase I family protein